jgi:predicted N-acetyltransferase YhbS
MYTTKTTIQIHRFTKDLSELVPLISLSCGKDDPAAVHQIIQLEKLRGTQYLVAEMENEIVGLIGYWHDDTAAERQVEPPQIIDLAVLPEYEGRGIAAELVHAAIQNLKQANCKSVWIQTSSKRVDDLDYFQQHGFEMVSLIADWCGAGISKAIFKKDL